MDTEDAGLDTLFKLGGLYEAIEKAFACPIDMVTVASLHQPVRASQEQLHKNIWKERISLYVAA